MRKFSKTLSASACILIGTQFITYPASAFWVEAAKAAASWLFRAAPTIGRAATPAARTVVTQVPKVAPTVGRALVAGAGSQIARIAITNAAKPIFQRQAANYIVQRGAVAASQNSGQTIWQYANYTLTAGGIIGLLNTAGVDTANASDVSRQVQDEVATATLHGADEHYLKSCDDDGKLYTIPSKSTHCLDGSEPKMLEKPLNLKSLRP